MDSLSPQFLGLSRPPQGPAVRCRQRSSAVMAALRGVACALSLLTLAAGAGATTTWTCATLTADAAYDAGVCTALNELYDASGGDAGALGALANWRACSTAAPCNYCSPGLENTFCDFATSTFIQTISFSGVALGSTIPASLSNFGSKLDGLTLSDCGLTGTIPPQLGLLIATRDFYLNGNALTGTMPPELAGLANCQGFSLSDNRLTGTLPDIFTSLASTAAYGSITLSNNAFSGTLPPSIVRGVSDSLRLDGNAFVSPLPDFTAATVTGLHIENNRFAEPFPAAALTLAPGLSTLFMENNSFTGALELPPTFLLQNAAYGFTLQVGGNKLTGMTIDPALCDFIQYYRASGSGFIYTMPNMWELNYTCDTVNDLIRICGGDSSGTFALQQACTAAASLPAAAVSLATAQAALATSQAALATSQAALATSQAAAAASAAQVATLQAAAVVDAATIAALRAAAASVPPAAADDKKEQSCVPLGLGLGLGFGLTMVSSGATAVVYGLRAAAAAARLKNDGAAYSAGDVTVDHAA